ncbi:MAG TPA: nicotinamide riboside transporter PnuC [Cyclobacteriaceae bacterium]|nr:nicotinamide riboside transporter PnuC [Cyclobacteriaceae bacterium]
MVDFITLVEKELASTDLVQWLVLIFGVAEVLLARANNILLYPTGLVAIVLSVYSLFVAQLYAECLLNLYYFFMSVYGWWYWIKKKDEPPVKISYTTRYEWIITCAIVFGGWLLLYVVLRQFTPSTVPIWDSWVSATAWAGMWLLARRKVENWLLLNISNIFAVPLLFQKGLPMMAILTIILFLVAVKGYFDWIKILRTEKAGLSPFAE